MMRAFLRTASRLARAILWIVLAAVVCGSGEITARADEPTLRYRRILVPQADLESQIRGLLPMKRDEFESRIEEVSRSKEHSIVAPVRLDRATYQASWDGGQVLAGTTEFEVHSAAEGPALLALGKFNLALHEAIWLGTPERTALVGHDRAGTCGCLVEQSGTMRWSWSLRGQIDATGRVSFLLDLPPAVVSHLTLDLPSDYTLLVEGGLASRNSGRPAAPPADDAQRAARQSWLVEIGGLGKAVLRIEPKAVSGPTDPVVTVRESSTYSLLRSTLDVETSLEIDSFQQKLRRLSLRVDQPLEIIGVRWGERLLDWFISASDARAATVTVDLPELPPGQSVTLVVQAAAAWPMDAPATLPRLALIDAVYQEGRAVIAAPSWLQLYARPLSGCWQSAVTPATTGGGTDQLQFRLHAANAAIEVGADLRPAELREASGTQITIDDAQISAVMNAELRSLGGSRFFVEARIPRRWIIDSVEVQPADALSDRLLTAATPDQQLLRLNLRRAISESRPLRVIVRGHHRRPPEDGPLPADFYRLATFADTRTTRRLVAVRSVEPGVELQLAGDDRLDPARLPEEEMRLFDAPPGTILFADDEGAADMAATLATAAPVYRAQVMVEALVASKQVQQVLTVRCLPESSQVGNILVQISPKPAGPIAWKLNGEDARELEVKPFDPAPAGQETSAGHFRINLTRPRNAPFEIQAEWTAPRGHRSEMCLVSIPEAMAQTGAVAVRSVDGSPLIVQATGVQSLPASASGDAQFSTLRGRYSYQPGSRASLSVVAVSPNTVPAAAWIESMRVRSRFSPAGQGEHEATLDIVNRGLSQLTLHLSVDAADVRLVDANGNLTVPSRTASGRLVLPLPPFQSRATLKLRYATSASNRRWLPVQQLTAPVPQLDVPLRDSRWSVAISPAMRACELMEPNSSQAAPSAKDSAETPGKSLVSLQTAFTSPSSLRALFASDTVRDIPSAENDLVGWHFYERDLPPGVTASIRVYQPAMIQGLAIAAFLLALAFVLNVTRGGLGWGMPLLGAALVAMVASPSEWMPVTAGIALGLFVGTLLTRLRAPARAIRTDRSTIASRRRLATLTSLAMLAALDGVVVAFAQQPPPPAKAPPGTSPADHRVVIAIDDDQHPTGDYVFLSAEFYDRLHRVTGSGKPALPDWLLYGSRYQLPATPQGEDATPSIDEIAAQFDLATFRPGVTLELPLQREQVLLLEGRSRFDGEPIVPTWRDDGKALVISIESPGKHRLELGFGAPAMRTPDAVVLDLQIPVVARSTAAAPLAAVAPPTIASARGGNLEPTTTALRETALGPTDRLAIHWPLADKTSSAARVELDQLLWWKLRPGSVVVEGKFRFHPIGGPQERVRISFDSRLRLVPGSITPEPSSFKVEEGAAHELEVTLPEKANSEFTVGATWLWVDASGAGNLALPRITAESDRVIRSWSAVSIDASLVLRTPAPARQQGQVSPDEFLIAWSEPDSAPTAAFDELLSPGQRSLSVLPALSQPTTATSAHWSIDRQRAAIRFEAAFTGVSRNRFQHLLDIPPSVKVTRVSLNASNEPVAHRWTQRPDGSLIITLLADPRPEQLLIVEGKLGLVRNRPRLPLPLIEIQQTQATSRQVRIYRHPDVRVRLVDPAGWIQADAPEAGHRLESYGRLVAELIPPADMPIAEPSITVSANRPQTTGQLALRLAGGPSNRFVEAELDLQIERGVLDGIRLDVPTEWSGPFEITPAVEHRVVPLPGGTAHQLRIWPQQAANGNLKLFVRGALRSTPGQPLTVPNIMVSGAPALERIVVLPSRLDNQPVDWETRGLQAIESGSVKLPENWAAGEGELYRTTGEKFHAAPTFQSRSPTRPRVSLADIQVRPASGRRLIGRAEFTVELAGDGDLTLEMPPDSRLINLSIGGMPAQCWPDGVRAWRVAATSQRVPVAIEALFETSFPPGEVGLSAAIAAPRLRGLDVERTVWSVNGLQAELGSGSKPALEATSELEVELERLESLAENLNRMADGSSSELPADVLAETYRYWHERYRQAATSMNSRRRAGRISSSQAVARLIAAEQTAAEAVARMAETGIRVEPGVADSTVSQESDETGADSYFMAAGWQPTIAVREESSDAPTNRRWTLAAAATALLGGAWMLLRSRAVREWLATIAPALIALAGLTWWLIAPWAWLGWILVGAGIWLSVRSPWPRSAIAPWSPPRQPSGASTS